MKSTGEEEMEDREKEKEREEEAEEEAYEGRNGESLQNYNIGRYDETSEIWVDSKMEAQSRRIPSVRGPKIPGMRKRRRKKRTVEKITCDNDAERGYWRGCNWRQTLDEPVVRCHRCWNRADCVIRRSVVQLRRPRYHPPIVFPPHA